MIDYKAPSQQMQTDMISVIVSTHTNRIARKITYTTENNKTRHCYEALETMDRLFIYPSSFLKSAQPSFVAYTEIIGIGE
jgi:hypothetical protein